MNRFSIERDGSTLSGAVFEPGSGPAKVPLIFCHGIPSGNPPDPNDGGYPALAEHFCGLGHPCAVFSFSGTGDSTGSFSIPNWRKDIADVIRHLAAAPPWSEGVVLVGFSGGAASSILAAGDNRRVLGVAAMASPADFDFITRPAQAEFVWKYFVELGIVDPEIHPHARDWIASFDAFSLEAAAATLDGRPLLIVHGEMDETVPVRHSLRLMQHAAQPKELALLSDAGHRLRRDEQALQHLADWLDRHFPPRAQNGNA